MSSLHDSLRLGALTLPNRIIMAPLTRCRASAGRVPNELMRDYYVQRASAGLIISEATAVDPKTLDVVAKKIRKKIKFDGEIDVVDYDLFRDVEDDGSEIENGLDTGGDEFVLLLENTSRHECLQTVERINRALGENVELRGSLITCAASLGVAEAEPPAPRKAPPEEPGHRPRIVWRREEAARSLEMMD